jgi:Tfp pilus assembly protein PilX
MIQPLKAMNNSQSGMVSIIVCMIMTIVISLVVLGFSQVSTNELNQAFNRQLSAEAYYAAFSGINNAAAVIKAAGEGPVYAQTQSCTTPDAAPPSISYNNNATLGPASQNASYTCVTVDPTPLLLKYSTDSAFPLISSTHVPITSITFNWQDQTLPTTINYDTCYSAGDFPAGTSTGWPSDCAAGVLEVDIIPASDIGSLAAEENGAKKFYLYPAAYDAGGAPPAGANTYVLTGTCNISTGCSYTIDDSYYGAGDDEYYVRVVPLYETANYTVAINGGAVPMYGSQVDLDATGDVQGVLQRINAAVSLNSIGGVPFAIQSGSSLCKLIVGYPGIAHVDTPTNIKSGESFPFSGNLSSDPGCEIGS